MMKCCLETGLLRLTFQSAALIGVLIDYLLGQRRWSATTQTPSPRVNPVFLAEASVSRPRFLVCKAFMRLRHCLSSLVPDGLAQAWALITYNAHVQRSLTLITYTVPRGLRLRDFASRTVK